MSNNSPTGPMVFLGTPSVGNMLTGRPNSIADADGIVASTVRFQWFRDGEPIPGATGQTYVLTSADLNAQISVSYSYLDRAGNQETVTSDSKTVTPEQEDRTTSPQVTQTAIEAIPTPNNSAPEGPMGILGEALVGNTLTARPNAIKDDDGINYNTAKFYWLRDGEPIPGATAQTYLVTDADRGAEISVVYAYYDKGGSYEVIVSDPEPPVPGGTISTPPPANDIPEKDETPSDPIDDGGSEVPPPPPSSGTGNNVPVGKLIIYGFPVEGATLEARNGAVYDQEGYDRDSGWYQWFRDGEPIEGATRDSYTISSADWGTSLSVQYTYVDFEGNTEVIVSRPEPPVRYPEGQEPEGREGEDEPIAEDPSTAVDDEVDDAPAVIEETVETTDGDDIVTITANMSSVDGQDGTDTAVLAGDQEDYTVTFSPDGVTVTDRNADGLGTVALTNFEFLDFGTELPVFGGPMDLVQFGSHVGLGEAEFIAFVEMYIAYFNRAPDAIGLAFWGSAFANGATMEEIAGMFADQPETLETYPADTSNIRFVADVYDNVLGRSPDIEGLRFWTDALDEGAVSRGEFILEVLRGVKADAPAGASQEFIDRQAADLAYLEAKTDLGTLFAVHRGMSNVDDATMVMELYDGSAESLATAVDAVDTLYAAAQDSISGDFLMPLVGVIDNPFDVA